MPRWFSDMLVPEFLLPPKIIGIGIFGSFDALLVGGCGAWAVFHKTPIYVMFSLTFTNHTY